MKTALYRHFDVAGTLLYVGISLCAVQRLGQHRNGSHWYCRISNVTIEWHESRELALQAEAVAISCEAPLHNGTRPQATGIEVWSKRRAYTFAILHVRSGRRDGNYFDQPDAWDMLAHWRAEFPREEFEMVVARSDDPAWPFGATDGAEKLCALDARAWEAAS